ncbi:MAG: hypothetical protein JSR34_03480 [Proteobacteria bacterium]|nr:hypothetical protein [Pseudomonadota bacterium]
MKLLKAIGVLIALWFVAAMAMMLYMPYRSSSAAHGFCDSVRMNEDLTALEMKARDGHFRHTKTNKDGIEEHHFWIPGIFETMSMCKVVISNGKVTSKQVSDN